MDDIQTIKAILEKQKFVTGTKETLKNLMNGRIETAFVTKNCPKEITQSLNKFTGQIKINTLEITNKELGVLCKKPFSISVLGILK